MFFSNEKFGIHKNSYVFLKDFLILKYENMCNF